METNMYAAQRLHGGSTQAIYLAATGGWLFFGRCMASPHRTTSSVSHPFALRVPARRMGERQREQQNASRRVARSTPAVPRAFSCLARRPMIVAGAVRAVLAAGGREAACGSTFCGGVRRSPGAIARAHARLRSTADVRSGTDRLQAPPSQQASPRSRSALRTRRAV